MITHVCKHAWQLISSKGIRIKYFTNYLEPAVTTVSTVEKCKVLSQRGYLHVLNSATERVGN